MSVIDFLTERDWDEISKRLEAIVARTIAVNMGDSYYCKNCGCNTPALRTRTCTGCGNEY